MIKNLKLLGISLLMAGAMLFVVTPSVDAFTLFGDACTGEAADSAVCEDSKSGSNPIYGPGGIIATAVTILSIVIGVAAVIVIIIAGIQYMLSTGDPTKVNNAKNAILYAVIGLIIAGLSQVIVQFVITKIG
jgi:hypothetical protein